MCISKALVGAQLRRSVREKECYKHVPFHLKTDHKNLVYINCALTRKVARWKLYMQVWNFTVSWVERQKVHQQVSDKLSRLVSNPEIIETSNDTDTATLTVAVAQVDISDGVCHNILSAQRNTRTFRGWRHLESIARRRLYLPESRIESTYIHSKMPTLSTDESDQTVSQSKRFTTAALYPFQVICADHVDPLPKGEEKYQRILVVICAFSRWIELIPVTPHGRCHIPTKTTITEETARCIHQHFGRWGTADRIRTDNGPAFTNDLITESWT